MRERLESFIELSEALTGFSRVQLLGTGMAEEYLRAVEEAVPAPVLEELLAAGDAVTILEDAKLGPVARNVILLWYCGTWTALARRVARGPWLLPRRRQPRGLGRVLPGRPSVGRGRGASDRGAPAGLRRLVGSRRRETAR